MTNQWVENWLAEIEATSEENRLELNRLQADQCLAKIGELEQKLVDVESLAAEEQMLIEKYRKAESDRITKRIRWLAASLEAFMREHNKVAGDKSLQLPHGQLKIRQQRDRIIVENAELLMPTASKHRLVRHVEFRLNRSRYPCKQFTPTHTPWLIFRILKIDRADEPID
jgi:hypothetical protein